MEELASSTRTERPARARVIAAARPFGPDPTTTPSYSVAISNTGGKADWLRGRTAIALKRGVWRRQDGVRFYYETHRHHSISVARRPGQLLLYLFRWYIAMPPTKTKGVIAAHVLLLPI